MKYKNVLELFLKRASKYGNQTMMRYKKRPSSPFSYFTWNETKIRIANIALGLKQLSVRKNDNVGLLSVTCHHWLACDFAIMALGAITIPLYHNSTGESIEYIAKHSDMEVIIVHDKIQLQKVRANWTKLPNLKYAIVMENKGDIPNNDPRILTLDDIERIGQREAIKNPKFLSNQVAEIDYDDVASIIYTSGTTGQPKGVVLTHRNFLVAALSFYEYVPLEEGMKTLSFLPLAHIFERIASELYGIDQGLVFHYCEKIEHLPKMLIESECQLMNVVPRILEKIYERVLLKVSQASPIQQKLFNKALAIGIEWAKKKINREFISWELELKYSAAKKLVLDKVKEQIAPKVKIFVVGGAPFAIETALFYKAIGFNVVEGYGLTETSAPITVNPPWANKPGTVGIPFKHFEVKIADDGEIICRGDSVFKEYYKDPLATSEAIIDGWFHTGDLGSFDDEGYLKITGRKKDLIITTGGKNVSPTRVEEFLLQSKYLTQVIILGDREKYLACLVVLNYDEVENWLKVNKIQVTQGVKIKDLPEVIALVEREIEKHGVDLASYEQVKAFHILEHELTIDSGELTPTLKIKRNVIRARYADVIKPLFHKSKSSPSA
jgi:long-chain acyl-CoA synthetase